MSYKILVTGGSGFIGTNLIDYYLADGQEVLNIDIKPPRNNDQTSLWKKADIRDLKNFKLLVTEFQPDFVLHMAARADLTGESLQDYSSNTDGVGNIIRVCNEISSVKKVIFASTQLVCKGGYIPKNADDYCPPNLYGQSKMIGEKLVKDASRKLNYQWVIIRPTSIWGPWFGPTYRGFFQMIINKRYFNYSGKMATKTYGYIGNTVRQIDNLLKADTTHSGTFYIGDYTPYNIKEWANEIAKEFNYSIIDIPRPIIWFSAKIGDLLSYFNLKPPMNSRRYKNMITDNIVPLEDTRKYYPSALYNRIEGNKLTIKWLYDYYLKS
jgi:GlcNAc-P-P-Und epimerase